MVADHVIGAREVGKTFAELVKNDPVVVGVWARRYRDVFEIWVLTDPIDSDHERKLYAEVGVLHDVFPYALMRVYLINLRNYGDWDTEGVLAEYLPTNAEVMYSRQE